MRKLRRQLSAIILVISILLLSACGTESSQASLEKGNQTNDDNSEFLYQGKNIQVTETPGWIENTNSSYSDEGNVVFENGKVKAIITVVSNEKSLEEIKSELKKSFANAEVIQESSDYVSLKTNRKESIRSDVYFNRGEDQTGIIIFMTPIKTHEKNKTIIEKFKNNVQYF